MPKTNRRKNEKQTAKSLHKRTGFSGRGFWTFAIAFGIAGSYVLLRSLAAPAPPTVYLTPAPQTFGPNTSFSIQIRENSGTTAVNAVQANFSYDPTLVDYVSTTASPTWTLVPQNTGGSGSVQFAGLTSNPVSNDQLVATVNFKTKTTSGTTNMAFTSGTALVSSSSGQDILGGTGNTAGGSYTVDASGPTVTITSPTNGATIGAPGTTTISVTATDSSSVSSVDFYIDGTKVSTDTVSPYSYSWNTSGVSLGSHTIQAKSTDSYNNLGSSGIFTVSLADQTAPTTSITAPAGGSVHKGTVTISATATDNTGGTGVAKVEFYVDGVLKGTDTGSPYSYSWNTTTATDAGHSLTVKAYDNASPANVTTSSAVSVTVDNSPPTQPGNFRTTSVTKNSASLAWNASTDNAGVTGYRLTRNGSTITTTSGSTLSYADSTLSPFTAYTYTVSALDSAGNASAVATLNVTTPSGKIGDFNNDNAVDDTDLSALVSSWATVNALYDLNVNSSVDVFDLSIFLSNFGK